MSNVNSLYCSDCCLCRHMVEASLISDGLEVQLDVTAMTSVPCNSGVWPVSWF